MLDKNFRYKDWILCEHKSKNIIFVKIKNIITSSFVIQWGLPFNINFVSKIVLLKTMESVEQCSDFSRIENVERSERHYDACCPTFSELPIIWHVWEMGCAGYISLLVAWEKLDSQYKFKTTFYFLHDSVPRQNKRLMGERLWICCCNVTQIQLNFIVLAPAWGLTMNNAAAGG